MGFFGAAPVRFGVSISGVTTTLGVSRDPELGTKIMDNGNTYRFVYNSGGSSITQNKGCVLASGASGYSVSVSSVIGVDALFGVAANNAIASAEYGWVMTNGFTDVETVSNVVSGSLAFLGTDGQFADPTAAGATAPTGVPCAMIQEQTAACGAAKAYIKGWG